MRANFVLLPYTYYRDLFGTCRQAARHPKVSSTSLLLLAKDGCNGSLRVIVEHSSCFFHTSIIIPTQTVQ